MKNVLFRIAAVFLIIWSALYHTIICFEADSPYATAINTLKTGGYTIHHLSDDGVCGATQFKGDNIDYEGFAGLKIHCNKTIVEYTMYSHSPAFQNGKVYFQYDDPTSSAYYLGCIDVDDTKAFNITDAANKMGIEDETGLYALTLMSGEDNKEPVSIYLYYDGNKVQTCRKSYFSQYDVERWNAIIGNLDPNTCLGMYVGNMSNPITYPTSGTNGACNHVQKWCDLSDEIVQNDDWSDEMKIFALVKYLTQNYAYDDYRVNTLNNTSRAKKKGVWNDDNLWMYYNKVGQCCDFANALTIMCRHQGIPCTSAENDGHTVNAVWMCGEWIAIDVSSLVSNHCDTEDTDPKNWKHYRTSAYNQYYGYYDGTMDTYNQALATPETTLSNRSGKNPM